MSDQQLALLLAGIGAGVASLGAVVKWAVTRITTALDANTAAHLAAQVAAATQAETLRALTVEVRYVAEWCDQHTGNADVSEFRKRHHPPAKGVTTEYAQHRRAITRGEEDE